ncbi:MAG TPA: rhodanese [Methylococcaceae bacterium]|jgi:rhodanese-related sulfurtransferase|nr:rhodanese [Methylococcaceae bacterium]HIN68571.1 rhodanese [Methylococcales bacterium]HIA45745.1 rhodanese [Methylococcaceae bacterium]HIB62852.1 rhodanese [Methylococcaceae bacterium]HIO12210.1 rhodanese [Methylococcales bacterium]
MTVHPFSVKQLKETRQTDQFSGYVLLDVRELSEFEMARIEGSLHIPMHQVPERYPELDKEQSIIVMCHHGMRSQQVAEYLVQCGFSSIFNLSGGIDAWSCECDKAVPRY